MGVNREGEEKDLKDFVQLADGSHLEGVQERNKRYLKRSWCEQAATELPDL